MNVLCSAFIVPFCRVKLIKVTCFIACTQTLFYFSVRDSIIDERARKESKQSLLIFFFFPHPYPLPLVVSKSPAVFIFYHARSTDLKEKIEGL